MIFRFRNMYLNKMLLALCFLLAIINPLPAQEEKKCEFNIAQWDKTFQLYDSNFRNVTRTYLSSGLHYIHKEYRDLFNQVAIDLVAYKKHLQYLIENCPSYSQEEKFQIISYEMAFISDFMRTIVTSQRDIWRFFEAGDELNRYPYKFFKQNLEHLTTLHSIRNTLNATHPFVWEPLIITPSQMTIDGYLFHDKIIDGQERMTVGIVDRFTRPFIKGKLPPLRKSARGRPNHLAVPETRQKVIDVLSERMTGARPGDILVEKDYKANNDLLIPGYWSHTAIYLGSIRQLKELDIWDDPGFAKVREDILEYIYIKEKIQRLRIELRETAALEDVLWVMEANRYGVIVSPIRAFLETDGMAVLRPRFNSNNGDERAIKEHMIYASQWLHFSYSYSQDIRTRHDASCAKLILKVYNDITFRVSNTVGYLTITPVDVAMNAYTTNPSINREWLDLRMFFDPEKKGELIFQKIREEESYKDNPKIFQTFLATIGIRKK